MSEVRPSIPEWRARNTRKGHVARTIVTLVLVGAMYTGLYFAMRGDAVGRMLFWAPVAVGVAVWLGLMIVFQVQARRFRRDCHDGVAALARGDLARARELYWSWSRKRSRSTSMSATPAR